MNEKQIREAILSPEYDFLRTDEHLGNNILFLGIGGSHSYGLATETSDLDIRGIAMNTRDELLSYQDFQDVKDTGTDSIIYSFNKTLSMLSKNNPNVLEIFGYRPEYRLFVSDVAQRLLDNPKWFLSQLCAESYTGFIDKQMRKLSNKSVRQVSQTEREGYILRSIQNAMNGFLPRHTQIEGDNLKLYIDASDHEDFDSEIFMDINLSHYPLRDWTGLWNEMKSIVNSYNKIGQKAEKPMTRKALAKHQSTIVMLYYIGIDILEKEDVIVYREKEHDLLRSIRNGNFLDDNNQTTQEFFELVSELDKRFDYAKKNTSLPETPDYKAIESFRREVNAEIIVEK